MSTLPAVLGAAPAHYQRLNLHPTRIEPWENGLRTDPATRSLEWWYYDCRLEDGTRLTVEFHTKPPMVSPSSPLTPFILLVMLRPSGAVIVKSASIPAQQFHASRERCEVVMGQSRCGGDASRHEVHVEVDGVVVDLILSSQLGPWRPASGHFFLGAAEERYFAWFLAMPRARVEAQIKTELGTERLTGLGYHDHNWGNSAPASIVDHWYWGHAHLGDYTLVALRAVSHQKYDKAVFHAFLFAQGDKVLAQGSAGMELTASGEEVEPQTGVPVAARLEYRLCTAEAHYAVDVTRRRDIFTLGFGDAGGYIRFVGNARLVRTANGAAPETIDGDGMWEKLSLGEHQARSHE
jgi:hypothetical protein